MGDLSGEILFEKFSIAECFKKDDHTAVYLADHIFLGKKIILKVLNTETIGDDKKIERFKREAKIMAKLEHPNIIKVLDFGMFKNYFYISQEYFKGYNLRKFIGHNEFSFEQTNHIFRQFFSALEYAHGNRVIHRDIKPENIFINDSLDVKIGDFGLALSISDNFVTGQFSIVGTPSYMSPEQISGGKLDARSDLFSSGIVMYELLTGKNPFIGKDINESINNIVNFDGLPETADVKFPQFIPIFEKLLRKSPRERSASATEILELLEPTSSEHIEGISTGKPAKGKTAIFVILSVILLLASGLYFISGMGEEKNGTTQILPEVRKNSPVDSNSSNDPSIKNELPGETRPEENSNQKLTKPVETETAPEQPVVKIPGQLDIECFPWAVVYINSRKIDTTPLEEPVELEEGIYHIRLVHPEFPVYEQDIRIFSGESKSIKVHLDTLFGYAEFNVFPWAEVIIDDSSYGHTPFNGPLRLMPGSHNLLLKNPAFPFRVEKLAITKNDTIQVNINLRKNLE